MATRYELDTNILVHLIRDNETGRALHASYKPLTADPKPLISIVTVGEIRERATQQMLEQFGMAGAEDEMREQVAKIADQQLKQDNGKLYRDTFEAIVADKVVAHLKGLVVVTDSDVTAEEFRTMSV